MSMLAEPRRKQKVINLRAKNNEWSNDTNKFGQRMLEKMGWSSGKGLGAKENGITEHVVAKYKNDDKGLGFEDRNDQWTKHEDDFNALLANLSNGDGTDDKLHSGISLEDKSKKSKARVHYHKFTRGKDLTRYSEKDLANIFGKKSLKNEENTKDIVEEDIKASEGFFTEKGSMEDYFKNKLAAFKAKNKVHILKNNDIEENSGLDYVFHGFSETTNDVVEENVLSKNAVTSFLFNNSANDEVKSENGLLDQDTYQNRVKKQKKKKKSKYQDVESSLNMCDNSTGLEKSLQSDCNGVKQLETEHESAGKAKKSKKKNLQNEIEKDKKKKHQGPESSEIIEVHEDDCHVPKKKKKRKNKDITN